MAILLLPPRQVPKTQEVSREPLGLAECNYADVPSTSGLERSLLPAAVNSVQMDKAKVQDKMAQNSSQLPQVSIPGVGFLSLCGLTMRKRCQNPT